MFVEFSSFDLYSVLCREGLRSAQADLGGSSEGWVNPGLKPGYLYKSSALIAHNVALHMPFPPRLPHSSMAHTARRLSASVVCVRKAVQDTYHVCLVRRSAQTSSWPDQVVFPGGLVEGADAVSAKRLLGTDSLDAVLRFSAIRETFEEVGIALTTPTHPHAPDSARWRQRVREDPLQFERYLTERGCAPDAAALQDLYCFITPDVEAAQLKKGGFYTQFYLCACDDAVAHAEADGQEVGELQWVTAAEALGQLQQHAISMAPPQFYILTMLQDCPDFSQLREFVRSSPIWGWRRRFPHKPFPIPRTPDAAEDVALVLPGDWEHPVYRGPSLGSRNRILLTGGFAALAQGRPRYRLQHSDDLCPAAIRQVRPAPAPPEMRSNL